MRKGWTLSPLTSVPLPCLYLFTSDLLLAPPGPGIPKLSCVRSQPHAQEGLEALPGPQEAWGSSLMSPLLHNFVLLREL